MFKLTKAKNKLQIQLEDETKQLVPIDDNVLEIHFIEINEFLK